MNQTVGSVPVTDTFAGDSFYLPSNGASSVTVSPPPPIPTTLKVNPATGQYNVATQVSGVLTNSTTTAPIANEPVTFKLNGAETCTGTTNTSGAASCYLTPGETPGSYPLTGTFGGDTTVSPHLSGSTGSNTFVVTPDPTVTVYTGATTAVSGQPATLSATLTTNGTPLAGKTEVLTLGSGSTVQTCSGTTNAAGSASCTIASVTQANGSVPVTASFAGTAYYLPSSASSTLIVGVATKLKVNAATGPYGQPTTVSALLTNANTSAAIVGEPVTLTLDGNETCTGITNSTGTASCSITPSEPAGTYPLTGTFAGDTTRSPVLFASSGCQHLRGDAGSNRPRLHRSDRGRQRSAGHAVGRPHDLRQAAAEQDRHLDPGNGIGRAELHRHDQRRRFGELHHRIGEPDDLGLLGLDPDHRRVRR